MSWWFSIRLFFAILLFVVKTSRSILAGGAALLLAFGVPARLLGDVLEITEFMAVNETKYADAATNYPDWIEVRDTRPARSGNVNIQGWHLTDDPGDLTKWTFPSNSIAPGQYLVVFASGSTNSLIGGRLHADFKLDGDGEYLALVNPSGVVATAFAPQFPPQYRDVSYGYSSSPTGTLVYFDTPTPNAANNAGRSAFGPSITNVTHTPYEPADASNVIVRATVAHDLGGGVATASLQYVVMYGATVTTNMYDDGAHNDGAAGDRVYAATIPSSAGTVNQMVRYAITARGVDGSTSRLPATGDPADYFGFVVYDPALSTNPPVLHWFTQSNAWESFGPSAGTWYTWTDNPSAWGIAYLSYQGTFYAGCRVRNKGSSTITAGLNKYKVVPPPGHLFRYAAGQPPVKEFNIHRFVGDESTYMREPLACDAMRAAGVPTYNAQYILFRYNGANQTAVIAEQQDEIFLERNGFDPDGALYKSDPNKATTPEKCSDLSLDWQNPQVFGLYNKESRKTEDQSDLNVLRTNLAVAAGSDPLKRYMFDNLNLPEIINQMAVSVVIGHGDRCEKNYYVYRDSDDTKEWSMFPWDFDTYLMLIGTGTRGSIEYVVSGKGEVRSIFYGDYGDWVNNRPHSWLHWDYGVSIHTGAYTNSYNRLYDAIIRMPATRQMYLRRLRTVTDQLLGPVAPGYLENRIDYFDAVPLANINAGTLKTYTATRRSQLYSNTGEFTNIPAAQTVSPPILFGALDPTPASGYEDQEFLELLNTNATAVDVSGWFLSNGVDFVFQAGTVIPARSNLFVSPDVAAFRAREISPRSNEANFVQGPYSGRLATLGETVALYDTNRVLISSISYTGAPLPVYTGSLRVSEVMYHPPNGDDEFIELCNGGVSTANLSTVRFTDGVVFDFAASVVSNLAPGASTVVVRDLAAFTNAHPGVSVAGQYAGSLNDGGEALVLYDTAQDAVIFSAIYASARGWPVSPDGAGHALVPVAAGDQADGRLDYGGNWRASAYVGGSPGVADPAPVQDVVLNEFMAHTDYTNEFLPQYDSNDWIEMFNTAGSPRALTNWFLSDDPGDLRKWRIPTNSVIGGGGWLTFDEVTGFHSPITNGFGLNKAGDAIYLSYLPGGAADRVADAVRFKGQENGVTEGRYPDGAAYWFALAPTTNAANAAPAAHVVIARIQYHPAPTGANPEDNTNDEFVELRNAAGVTQALWTVAGPWRVDGLDFAFPSNTTLGAGATLMLVSFDPSNVVARSNFFAAHGFNTNDVTLYGPYGARLSNHGERLAVERPQEPDLPGEAISWVIVDEAIYFDADPWTNSTDGTGLALVRTSDLASGNDPGNWTDGVPPPDPDGDGDGLRDVWEESFFGSTNAPGGEATNDFDGDGVANWNEYTAGTDPTNDSAYFGVEIDLGGSTVLVSFLTIVAGPEFGGAQRFYTLENLTNLAGTNWFGVGAYTNILGTNQAVIYQQVADTNLGFYRGHVWLEGP